MQTKLLLFHLFIHPFLRFFHRVQSRVMEPTVVVLILRDKSSQSEWRIKSSNRIGSKWNAGAKERDTGIILRDTIVRVSLDSLRCVSSSFEVIQEREAVMSSSHQTLSLIVMHYLVSFSGCLEWLLSFISQSLSLHEFIDSRRRRHSKIPFVLSLSLPILSVQFYALVFLDRRNCRVSEKTISVLRGDIEGRIIRNIKRRYLREGGRKLGIKVGYHETCLVSKVKYLWLNPDCEVSEVYRRSFWSLLVLRCIISCNSGDFMHFSCHS
jgi:hypothetical protein